MDITLYVDDKRYKELLEKGLSSSFGYYAHNVAVMCAPYDTGNLRRAISLAQNTPKAIRIQYNHMIANYIYFLEEGIGPVTKHKGFISNVTAGAITEQLIGWVLTGKDPMFTPQPVVVLRTSKYRPFNVKSNITGLSERDVLRQADMYSNAISASARKEVSKVRETAFRTLAGGKITNQVGMAPSTTQMSGSHKPFGDKNIGILRGIVQERKKEYLANRQESDNLANMRFIK